ALVGVFELWPHLARTEIKLGADAGVAQGRDHLLVIGDALAVEHRDDDRAGLGLALDLAEVLQRRHQSRHADGESRRRHRLAAKAFDQSVVAPTAANRAEAHRSALVILSLECQIHFEHWPGVVLKAADNRSIDFATISIARGSTQRINLAQFMKPASTRFCRTDSIVQINEG